MAKLLSVMILLGCLVLAPAYAQDSAGQAEREQSNSAQESQAKSQAEAQAQAQSNPAPSRPASTFTPSERIRADTSVAFPADI